MKKEEFINRLCQYARTNLAPKCSLPATMMAIGAATAGVGRRSLERKLSPYLDMAVQEDGELDLEGIRESIMAGLELAKRVPVLGGLMNIDANDASEFFAYLKSC